jgi:hypothetical protein
MRHERRSFSAVLLPLLFGPYLLIFCGGRPSSIAYVRF